MATFKDKTGKAWTLAVDINVVRRVRLLLGVNLADCLVLGDSAEGDEKLFRRLARDPVLLVDLLFVLCEEQCGRRKLTDEQFAAIFDGPSIQAATVALIKTLNDFFQTPASKLALLWEEKLQARATKATAKVEALTDDEWDKLFDATMTIALANASRSGSTSPTPPDTSASTSDAGPSANSTTPSAAAAS